MLLGVLMVGFGCAPMPSKPLPPPQERPEPTPSAPVPEKADSEEAQAPRTVASLTLTEQARVLIESKKPDEAIRLLEKSMNLDPHNGQNYYFLAEAWLMKGNGAQAFEFNRMAGIYLNADGVWMKKVREQKRRIEKQLKK